MRWFTSDTHFAKTGDKILRREMRPYKTIKEYCDDQIRIWNEQASRDDVIYHLGDMCNYNGTEKDFLPGLMLVQEVNAKVILIMGNNEERVMQYCFENNFEKFRDFCIRHGFLDVKQNDTISIDGAKLYLVHRPIDCKPGMLNLYGHVHRQGGIWSPYGFNICTDVNHFRLYSENDIRFLISQKAAWDNDADTKFLAGLTFSPRLKRGDSCINHHCAATEAVASYTMSDRRYFPCVPRYGMY